MVYKFLFFLFIVNLKYLIIYHFIKLHFIQFHFDREVTLTLPKLVSNGFLISHGEKRDKSYTLPGVTLPSPDEVFASNPLSFAYDITDSGEIITDKVNLIADNNFRRDEKGYFASEKLFFNYEFHLFD